MSNLKLLPRGYFEISLEGGTIIKGRFCTWTMKRFCDKVNATSLNDMLKVLTDGISISNISQFLLSAVEYTHRGNGEFKYTEDDAYEWMDELGGVQGTELIKLISSAIAGNEEAVEEEKKTVVTDGLAGVTSSDLDTVRDSSQKIFGTVH